MTEDDVRDLLERLEKAEDELRDLAHEHWEATERERLRGKAQGVGLARSYLREYLR